MSQQYRAADGETVDQICRQYYGYSNGSVEAVYEANRGLADHGPFLPAGLVITLPELGEIEQKVEVAKPIWN
ncbi:phage tail protein [Natronospirillum operosum]|uniref:Phage tail protein n=1 Tax=Natronospirillum operosum TaxID=2759953 RepID=A0A4Z0W4U0_9GAMM|nr:tail protein X [Natronospirillum operosum]TGG92537.1 phage tail protein [Natronospirillum operosum]